MTEESDDVTTLRRRLIPYGLLGPGILWLILFFVVPMYFMGRLSLETGIFPTFQFDWHFANYTDALSAYDTQFIRAFEYSAAATRDRPADRAIRSRTRSPSAAAGGRTRCCSRWWRRSSPPT